MGLLKHPNPAQGRAELLEALYGQLLLTGDAYIEAAGGESGVPLELHVLRSDRMSLVPGGDFQLSVAQLSAVYGVGAFAHVDVSL